MDTFSLKLISSDGVFFEGPCEQVIIPTPDGLVGILAHHENVVIAVEIGQVQIKPADGDWIIAAVARGFMEVMNNRVSVLVNAAERPEDIDLRRAQEAKERAEEELRQKQSIKEYHLSQASLARAMTRLKTGNRNMHI